MNEEQALCWLKSLEGFSFLRYDLNGITKLLIRLGRPDESLRIVHIAGTNGKGSVAKLCGEALFEAGKKTGLFISPHILSFEERIQINGQFIQLSSLISLVELVRPLVEELANEQVFCSQFDVLTAIALEHFRRCGCDFVVLEVGMGGRRDSTNAVLASSVELSIITKIGFDHVNELGATLEEIAFEKAGIIKPGVVCVCSGFEPVNALKVLEQTCRQQKAKLVIACAASNVSCGVNCNLFEAYGQSFETRLSGPFQVENATIALTALRCLNVNISSIKKAFKRASWPVRFEFFKAEPALILDGAHNFDGVCALSKALELCELEPKVGVFSVLKTKDYYSILGQVEKMGFSKLILTKMNHEQAVEVDELEFKARSFKLNVVVQPNWRAALNLAKQVAGKKGLVVVFGSLYFAAQVRHELVLC